MNEETKQLEMHAMTIEKAIEEKILPLGILESTLDLEENEQEKYIHKLYKMDNLLDILEKDIERK